MRLIGDGVVDREGVAGLAARLGYSVRQLNRLVSAELGAGPLALARAQRAQTARTLIETTDLGFAEVAFAAGFASVRQFNDTVREVFALTPSELRRRRGRPDAGGAGAIALRLPYRSPIALDGLLAFFAHASDRGRRGGDARTARTGARCDCRTARRSPSSRPATAACSARCASPTCATSASPSRAAGGCSTSTPIPTSVAGVLASDPLLAPLVAARPGLRVPGCVDGTEIACARCSASRSPSRPRARTRRGSSSATASRCATPDGSLTHVFPGAAALATRPTTTFSRCPQRRRDDAARRVRGVARRRRSMLDPGADRERARRDLLALPGIGPWTVEYVAMRALGDPDAFPASDLGVLHGLRALGVEADAREAERRSQAWRPFRAYTVLHLWKRARERRRGVSETYTTMPSPVGELLLTGDDGHADGPLPARRQVRASRRRASRRRAPGRRAPSRRCGGSSRSTSPASAARSTLPVAPGGTPFQQAVWAELQRVGYGTTITYAELAARIGRPTAIRAAGAANGANPVSIVIPCHRVIGSNGALTGYGGGLEAKRFLLELERAGA